MVLGGDRSRHHPRKPVAARARSAWRWSPRQKKAEIIRKKFEFARVKAGVLRGFYYLDPDWSKDEREQPRASSSFCRRSKISIAPPPFCIYFTVSNNGKIQYTCAE